MLPRATMPRPRKTIEKREFLKTRSLKMTLAKIVPKSVTLKKSIITQAYVQITPTRMKGTSGEVILGRSAVKTTLHPCTSARLRIRKTTK
jgi:hypothetical protein